MRGRRSWPGLALGILIALGGCAGPAEEPVEPGTALRAPVHSTAPGERAASRAEQELNAAREHIAARADSVRRALRSVRGLSSQERADLRRDVNERQVATARSFGVRAGSDAEVARLVQQGRLVPLPDSTEYWVLRDLEYSVPYVTPDTRALLEELGRRFHARLDSLGLPRYRMEVTSALRTAAKQADLRGANSNAARGVSAHEFGTTVDVAHMRFAAPADSDLGVGIPAVPEEVAPMRYVEALVLAELGRLHAGALQAELGRVLREMRQEGKLRVMMERRQAVYHMTVARRFPARSAAS